MIKSFFAVLFSLVVITGCVRSADSLSKEDGCEHALYAYCDGDVSKSVFTPGLGSSTVSWENGDRINVFSGSYGYVYQATQAGSRAYFEPVGLKMAYSDSYYAIYPYQEDVVFKDGKMSAQVPSQQEVVRNGLACHLAVAHSELLELYFKNVCGLFRVRVSEMGIEKITLRGNADEDVAGRIMVDALDASWEIVSGEKEIVLEMPQGQTFAEADYYMALLPQTFSSGVTVTAYKTDGSTVVKNVSREIILQRNAILGGEFVDGVWTVGTSAADLSSIDAAQDLVLAPDGGFYMTVRGSETNHAIYKVSADGVNITKLASTDDKSYPWGGDFDDSGLFYFVLKGAEKIATCTSGGVVADYPVGDADLTNAMKVLVGDENNLYVLARGGAAGEGKVYKIKDNAVQFTWNLNNALYETMCFNADETAIFVFANSSGDIQMIDLASMSMARIAGNGVGHSSAKTYHDAIPGYPLTATIGVTSDAICASDGTIYFTDTAAKTLRKFIPGEGGDYSKGTISTIAGKIWPMILAADVATPKDGQGLDAVFAYPEGLAFAADGKTLYVVDGTFTNCKIRKVSYVDYD